jgi:hypothetical protein
MERKPKVLRDMNKYSLVVLAMLAGIGVQYLLQMAGFIAVLKCPTGL